MDSLQIIKLSKIEKTNYKNNSPSGEVHILTKLAVLMNENNYRSLDAYKFAEIIQGKDSTYIIPQTSNARASWMETNRVLREAGVEPEISVMIPTSYDRNLGRRKHDIQNNVPKEYWPDFEDPLVYKIIGSVFVNRDPYSTLYSTDNKTELSIGIDLQHCQFGDSFSFNKVACKGVLSLFKCTFNMNSILEYPSGGFFGIIDSTFKIVRLVGLIGYEGNVRIPMREIKINELTTDELIVENTSVSTITINCVKRSIRKIIIKNSIIERIILEGNSFGEVELLDIKGGTELYVNGQFVKFSLSNADTNEVDVSTFSGIKKIEINFENQLSKGYFNLNNMHLNCLIFKGSNNNNVFIKRLNVKEIIIDDFYNSGELIIRNISGISEIKIKDSSLGKAEMLDVDLLNSLNTQIFSSNISEVVLLDTIFPDNLISDSPSDYKGKREAFRQLKLAASKQGNRIGELKYEAQEMAAYKSDTLTDKTLTDKLILFTNEWSNNHGQDASKALLWLVLTSTIFYVIIKQCQGYCLNLNYALSTAAEYLNFAFNPLHDYYKLFNINSEKEIQSFSSDLARFIDAIARLLSGYLIFQFLRAFRKFVK